MPTTRPRYTVTDSGAVRNLLDDASRHWPDVHSRKELLLRLAQTGHDSLNLVDASDEAMERRERQLASIEALRDTVDWHAIRDDQAWR